MAILLGTARATGRTAEAAAMLAGRLTACETIDLRIPGLRPFGYDTATIDDDAFRIIIHRLSEAQDIVFATPVYTSLH